MKSHLHEEKKEEKREKKEKRKKKKKERKKDTQFSKKKKGKKREKKEEKKDTHFSQSRFLLMYCFLFRSGLAQTFLTDTNTAPALIEPGMLVEALDITGDW